MANDIDLIAAAHEVMLEQGLVPYFPESVAIEVSMLNATSASQDSAIDLRALPWSSIDNAESRDLDQVEVAEMLGDDVIRLLIGIADVDAFVPRGSAMDHHALVNTVSVYAGVTVFPMLPERLSTDLTSLNEAADRPVIVTELHIARDGTVVKNSVFRALARNHAKLDYVTIGQWLDGGPMPAALAAKPELEAQIRLQADAAARLERVRREAGALSIDTIEARTVMENGKVVGIAVVAPNAAREIIENFMVNANVTMARFLVANDLPAIRRVVRTPRRWDRIVAIAAEFGEVLPAQPQSPALGAFLERRKAADPEGYPDLSMSVVKLLGAGEYVLERSADGEGHFGLAVAEYTHSTAPNRRYPDLIVQRLAKAALAGQASPYTDAELDAIAIHCTKQEDAARKVERTMRKKAAAMFMQQRIGEVFDAVVTGASAKGLYVRLLQPAVEGRVVNSSGDHDVGAALRVRLVHVDAAQSHIDFEISG